MSSNLLIAIAILFLSLGVYAYITLKEHDIDETEDEIIRDLQKLVKSKIAGYAVPEMVQVRFL